MNEEYLAFNKFSNKCNNEHFHFLLSKHPELIIHFARRACALGIVYDTRTGRTPGCVNWNSYSLNRKFEGQNTRYFDKNSAYCSRPALDCSGFVSWLFFILGLEEDSEPLNEDDAQKKYEIKGTGVWNIFENPLLKTVEDDIPLEGDLIFFPTHIGIVSRVDNFVVKEIIHSSPANGGGEKSGPKVTPTCDYLTNLLASSRTAVVMAMDKGVTGIEECRYLLGRVKTA